MPVSGGVAADDPKFRGGDASAFCLLNFELRSSAQTFECEHNRPRIGAGIDQSADRHISADAGERIEVADFHAINWGNTSPEGPWRNSPIRWERGVSAVLISMTRAPDALAICASPAAGYTTPEVPITRKTSAARAAAS